MGIWKSKWERGGLGGGSYSVESATVTIFTGSNY